jgi:hypothetical protein
MLEALSFDRYDFALDVARLSTSLVSVSLLFLLAKVCKQRKYIRGSYYSPVLIFTAFWLVVLCSISTIPIIINLDVISDGLLFSLLSAAYIWSLAGLGWIVLNYFRSFNETIKVVRDNSLDPNHKKKAD